MKIPADNAKNINVHIHNTKMHVCVHFEVCNRNITKVFAISVTKRKQI